MQYDHVESATFLDRPNRFIAHVAIHGKTETVHVKNTGRCRELLIPGAEVFVTAPGTPGRKTKYDLIAVRKGSGLLVNIDSQAPNVVVREWLNTRGFDEILPEHRYGDSRIDFFLRRGGERYLMEVKGCTLEVDGIGFFPDAPTERGLKHLRELTDAVKEGLCAILAFAIQMDGITWVKPNVQTHPAFAEALEKARQAGVRILFLPCHVEPDSLTVSGAIWERSETANGLFL